MRFLSGPQRLRGARLCRSAQAFFVQSAFEGLVQTFVGGFIAAVTLM
jgi:hypothetical protein